MMAVPHVHSPLRFCPELGTAELGPAGGHSAVGPGLLSSFSRGRGNGRSPAQAGAGQGNAGTSMGIAWVYIQQKLLPLFLLDGFKILILFFFLFFILYPAVHSVPAGKEGFGLRYL